MEKEKILGEIGLTKNEIKIYLALLKLGTVTSWSIIKETSIHTSKVYDGTDEGRIAHDDSQIRNVIETNLIAPLVLAKKCLPFCDHPILIRSPESSLKLLHINAF